MPSRVPDEDLRKIETWLTKHGIAGSALGRKVADDQALISRWRRDGATGVSDSKRAKILQFIESHPNGAQELKSRKGPKSKRFIPAANGPNEASVRRFGEQSGSRSTELPVPGITQLDREQDQVWLRRRAQERGIPLVAILCEMVTLGIKVTQEIEREEEIERLEQEAQQLGLQSGGIRV
jgi:hypothetical protein